MTKRQWAGMAAVAAQEAHDNNFQSRRGVYQYDHVPDVLYLYNNNPYAADSQARERETERIRARLKEAGVEQMAYATYADGYTYAMILRGEGIHLADSPLRDLVEKIVMEETAATMRELRAKDKDNRKVRDGRGKVRFKRPPVAR